MIVLRSRFRLVSRGGGSKKMHPSPYVTLTRKRLASIMSASVTVYFHLILRMSVDSREMRASIRPSCFLSQVRGMPETVVHFQVRMPPRIHESLASRAREEKASLNALVVSILEQAIAAHEASRPPEAAAPTPR